MSSPRSFTPTPSTLTVSIQPSLTDPSLSIILPTSNQPTPPSPEVKLFTHNSPTFANTPPINSTLQLQESSNTSMARSLRGSDSMHSSPSSQEGELVLGELEHSGQLTAVPIKKKRTRTLTTPHQSAVLHALLAQSRFPTTAMREEVGRSIGLSARKVQIWFQNQRQKARRPKHDEPDHQSELGAYSSQESHNTQTTHFAEENDSKRHHPHEHHPYRESRGRPESYSPNSKSLRGSQKPAYLSGPGMPGSEPRDGGLFRGRDLPPPSLLGHGRYRPLSSPGDSISHESRRRPHSSPHGLYQPFTSSHSRQSSFSTSDILYHSPQSSENRFAHLPLPDTSSGDHFSRYSLRLSGSSRGSSASGQFSYAHEARQMDRILTNRPDAKHAPRSVTSREGEPLLTASPRVGRYDPVRGVFLSGSTSPSQGVASGVVVSYEERASTSPNHLPPLRLSPHSSP